jgi:hypothetical protein
VFLSTNNGSSWAAVNTGLANTNIWSLAVSGTILFAGSAGGGVFLSTNNGSSWAAVNTGLANNYVDALAVSGTNLFAGTYDGNIWRRALSEMITSVESRSTNFSTHFSLAQNYPNPFNPSTTIQYELPAQSTIRLVIYNVLGQVVKEIVNTEQQPGIQSVVWNTNVSSGLYFYRLEATSKDNPSKRFVETKKMLLLK